MRQYRNSAARWVLAVMISVFSLLAGCYVGLWGYSQHWNQEDSALGEEHQVYYPAADAYQITQDALRGDGILFEIQPNYSLITLWRSADNVQTGFFASLTGVQARYHYEIQVVPEGSRKSKIVVNVRTEGIPDNEVAQYKASTRFELFKEIDDLAAKFPPPPTTPASGGVNFTLLPNEDLKGLAKRATGNEDNWRQIAKDNGLNSPTDVSPFQSIWIANSMLPQKPTPAPSSSPTP